MDERESQRDYIEELRAFLAFLKNLWGLLAGTSIFFPLSNVLLRAIPLSAYGEEDGVFDQISPFLITTLATVVTLFVVLVTFSGRDDFREPAKSRRVRRAAWLSFGISILSLFGYLIIHQFYREYGWASWGWGSGDPRKLIAEIPLLVTYIIFFSLLTRAFMLLGMIEFFGKKKTRDSSLA